MALFAPTQNTKTKSMLLTVSLGFLLMAVCIAEPSQDHQNLEYYHTFREHITGRILMEQRRKRATSGLVRLALEGLKAVEFLLKGSVKTQRQSPFVKEYEKVGNLGTALLDFKSVNPSFVQKFTLPNGVSGRIGEAGDRTIVLKTGGKTGTPSIEIVQWKKIHDSSKPRTQRILYKNKVNYK